MKKIIAWTCLTIYLNAAAQSLLPWVSDCLAHAFNWQDHLEHVHNGHVHSHHVGLAMSATEKDSTDHPVSTPGFPYTKDALSAHLLPLLPVGWEVTVPLWIVHPADWSFFYQSVVGDILLPPPNQAG